MDMADHLFAGAVCAVAALLGASVISFRQATTIGQAVITCIVITLLGAVTPSFGTACLPFRWPFWIAPSLMEGLLAYGILDKLEVWRKKLPDADITGPLSDFFKRGNKP